jgi:outer membrane protein TolC
LGVTITLPGTTGSDFWDFWKTNNVIDTAQNTYESNVLKNQDDMKKTMDEVEQEAFNLSSGALLIEAYRQSLESAKLKFDADTELFNLGQLSVTDYDTSISDYQSALSDLSSQRYKFYTYLSNLRSYGAFDGIDAAVQFLEEKIQ